MAETRPVQVAVSTRRCGKSPSVGSFESLTATVEATGATSMQLPFPPLRLDLRHGASWTHATSTQLPVPLRLDLRH